MCCRYYYDSDKINNHLKALDVQITSSAHCPGGIIVPGREALMIAEGKKQMLASAAIWGFPCNGNKLVINARSETAANRIMFQNALETRRCLLPAECFYEWDHDKNKATFSSLNTPIIYLAGLWSLYNGETRFVILTTIANKSMIPVHDRMPLMIDPGNIDSWLFDTAFALNYLKTEMPQLRVQREYEQISLFG